MKYFTADQICLMHRQITAQTGGNPALRDRGLLESAAAAPLQTFGGVPLYPELVEKAARLGYSLIKNHPFADGNKRIGAHAMLMLLALNGVSLRCDAESLTAVILNTAGGNTDADALCAWLRAHLA